MEWAIELIVAVLAFALGGALVAWRMRRARTVRAAPLYNEVYDELAGPLNIPAPRIQQSRGLPAALVVHSGGSALMHVAPMAARSMPRGTSALPPGLAKSLGPLIEKLPALASAANSLSADTYRVVVSAELRQGLLDGSLSWMRSKEAVDGIQLNVIDRGGKIIGQGTNIPVSKVAQIFSASFQVGSFVFGQAHLAQIGATLKRIEGAIANILERLEGVQIGSLLGKHKYMQDLAASLQAGELHESDMALIHSQLETVEREALESGAAIEIEMSQRRDELDAVDMDQIFQRIETDAEELQSAAQSYAAASRKYHLVQSVRIAAVQLKCALPGVSRSRATVRMSSIAESLRMVDELDTEVGKIVKDKASELSGGFSYQETIEELEGEIRSAFREELAANRADRARLIQQAKRTSSAEEDSVRRADEDLVLFLKRGGSGTFELSMNDEQAPQRGKRKPNN
jgi:hypothetical protein